MSVLRSEHPQGELAFGQRAAELEVNLYHVRVTSTDIITVPIAHGNGPSGNWHKHDPHLLASFLESTSKSFSQWIPKTEQERKGMLMIRVP